MEHAEQRHRNLQELPLASYSARVSDWRIEYVSPQVERLLELPAEQAIAEQDFWGPRLHALDRSRVLREWRRWCADSSAEPFRGTYRMVTDLGRVIWVDDVTMLDGPRAGGELRFQRHLLDVSEQRQLEEQLRQAQKFEALGRLAGGVAHDFNNLLERDHRVLRAARARTAGDAARRERCSDQRRSRPRAALVRQLLSFPPPPMLQPAWIDLNTLRRESRRCSGACIGEDVELELGLERTPLTRRAGSGADRPGADEPRGQRARREPGGGRDHDRGRRSRLDACGGRRSRHRHRRPHGRLDTGAGMDAANRERIFEPFFTTKERGQGPGLGLATVYGIVTQANGTLAVSSAPGRGTTFRIHLPLAASGLEALAKPTAEPAAPPKGGPERVLLVEDLAALRELEQIMLEDAGYRVHPAADAAEALELTRRYAFDLLVADVVMPGLSGPQLADELRARGCDLPTIFVSGYGSDRFSSHGVGAANVAVVQKPFYAGDLLATVRAVLDSPSAGPSARPADPHSPRRSLRAAS